MKKFTLIEKILLTVLLAMVVWAIHEQLDPDEAPGEEAAAHPNTSAEELRTWYLSDNDNYFGGKLPKDTVINWDDNDPNTMAQTQKFPDGHFEIQLNSAYAGAERTQLYLLLHESCHIETWAESHPDGIFFDATKQHEKLWRTCMLRIDAADGFRDLFIDEYKREK